MFPKTKDGPSRSAGAFRAFSNGVLSHEASVATGTISCPFTSEQAALTLAATYLTSTLCYPPPQVNLLQLEKG